MSKYTVSIYDILSSNADGEDISTLDGIKTVANKVLFGEEINVINPEFREKFVTGFALHYLWDEIGAETFPMWRFMLMDSVYNNADFVNQTYENLEKMAFDKYHITKTNSEAARISASTTSTEGTGKSVTDIEDSNVVDENSKNTRNREDTNTQEHTETSQNTTTTSDETSETTSNTHEGTETGNLTGSDSKAYGLKTVTDITDTTTNTGTTTNAKTGTEAIANTGTNKMEHTGTVKDDSTQSSTATSSGTTNVEGSESGTSSSTTNNTGTQQVQGSDTNQQTTNYGMQVNGTNLFSDTPQNGLTDVQNQRY